MINRMLHLGISCRYGHMTSDGHAMPSSVNIFRKIDSPILFNPRKGRLAGIVFVAQGIGVPISRGGPPLIDE
jgi:hypothetical protein